MHIGENELAQSYGDSWGPFSAGWGFHFCQAGEKPQNAETPWAVRDACPLHFLSPASSFPVALDSSLSVGCLYLQHPGKKLELNILPREEGIFSKVYILWEGLENDSEQLGKKVKRPKMQGRVSWFPELHSFHLISVNWAHTLGLVLGWSGSSGLVPTDVRKWSMDSRSMV